MKAIAINGLLIGLVMLVVTFSLNFVTISIFPEYQTIYENTKIFRAPDDPLLMLYLLFPFALGWALAWVWGRIKQELSGSLLQDAWNFSLGFLFVIAIPTFLVNIGSFNLPVIMMISWLLTSYINGFLAALILGKLDAPLGERA